MLAKVALFSRVYVTIDIAHVISDTRPSRFSACNIEKLGRTRGRG